MFNTKDIIKLCKAYRKIALFRQKQELYIEAVEYYKKAIQEANKLIKRGHKRFLFTRLAIKWQLNYVYRILNKCVYSCVTTERVCEEDNNSI